MDNINIKIENDTDNNDNNDNNDNIINAKIESDEDFKELVEYLNRKEKIKNQIDKYNKGWNKENISVVNYWMDYISYCCLIYHFYLFKLKKIESYWAWMIIIFSSISSTLSLLQYNQNDQNDQSSYTYYSTLIVKIFLTILTLLTTLISAWMKKQNYVENISELSKYSLKINKLKGDVNSVMREPIDTRMSYETFINKYKDNIINYISVRPLISPNDWKYTIYVISKYYPELAAYEYPWNKIPDYGKNSIQTYKNIKYKSIFNKLKYGYYCKSKCCENYDKEYSDKKSIEEKILETDIQYYKDLPENDFDSENYNCNIYSYDSDIFKKNNKESEIIKKILNKNASIFNKNKYSNFLNKIDNIDNINTINDSNNYTNVNDNVNDERNNISMV